MHLAAAEVKYAIQNENKLIGQKLSLWHVHALECQRRWPRWTCISMACTPMRVRLYAGKLQAESLCCKKLVKMHNLCHRIGIRRDGVGLSGGLMHVLEAPAGIGQDGSGGHLAL